MSKRKVIICAASVALAVCCLLISTARRRQHSAGVNQTSEKDLLGRKIKFKGIALPLSKGFRKVMSDDGIIYDVRGVGEELRAFENKIVEINGTWELYEAPTNPMVQTRSSGPYIEATTCVLSKNELPLIASECSINELQEYDGGLAILEGHGIVREGDFFLDTDNGQQWQVFGETVKAEYWHHRFRYYGLIKKGTADAEIASKRVLIIVPVSGEKIYMYVRYDMVIFREQDGD